MSYQQFLRSTSNPHPAMKPAPPPAQSPSPILRKSPGSINKSPSIASSINTTVSRNRTPSSTQHTPAPGTAPSPATPYTQTPGETATGSTSTMPGVLSNGGSTGLPARSKLSTAQIDAALHNCLAVQTTATTVHRKRPFAALLLGPDHTTVLLTHFSISHVQHAESELVRLAVIQYTPQYLSTCTLVSTWEPCAMCAGTIYWSNIGCVLYGAGESRLKELTGDNNEENMTMSLPCRDVFKAGQRDIEVIGPVATWEIKIVDESRKWWKEHPGSLKNGTSEKASMNGSVRSPSISSAYRQGTPTTWTGEEHILSSIDDEGEYKADLDIDWMR